MISLMWKIIIWPLCYEYTERQRQGHLLGYCNDRARDDGVRGQTGDSGGGEM